MKAYIGGVSYELGEDEFLLENVKELSSNKELITALRRGEFDRIRESNLSVLELLEKSLQRFLNKKIIDPKRVDAIIIATSSLGFTTHLIHSELSAFLIKLGLNNAYPILSSLSFCGNLLPALNTARSYIMSGVFKNVLVVVGDIIPKNTSKLTPPSMAIGSDGSACCLISKDPIFKFEIGKIAFSIAPEAGLLDPDKDFMRYTKLVGEGIKSAVTQNFDQSSIAKDQLSKVFTNNYSHNVCNSFLRLVGVSERLLFAENIPRFGHAGAADILINFCDYLEESEQLKDDNFLLLSTGPFMWSSTIINRL